MNKKVGILILHGIGIQKKHYSDELIDNISSLLIERGYDPAEVKFQEILYSDIFDKNQKKRKPYLLGTSHPVQLISRFIRWALVYVLSDAVSYRAKYKKVHKKISDHLDILYSELPEDSPVIIIAHSMGVMTISDYIYDLQENKYPELKLREISNLSTIISMGSNIPLFEMGHDNTVCIKKPHNGPGQSFSWINFYSPFDVLGYKLKNYYTSKPEPSFNIKDEKVFPGGIRASWNFVSHTCYWKNKKVISTICNKIIKNL